MSEPIENEIENWMHVGDILLQNDKIILPAGVPTTSGVYPLGFRDGSFYIGEASDLNRRLGDYHTPGQGIESEFRIHRAIKRSHPVRVEVQVGPQFTTRSQRCVYESRMIKQMRDAGQQLLNGGDIQEQIAFHESEIARLRAKLNLKQKTQEANHA